VAQGMLQKQKCLRIRQAWYSDRRQADGI
jgi:hypothetical protein